MPFKIIFFVLAYVFSSLSANARERTPEEIMEAAKSALTKAYPKAPGKGVANRPVQELYSLPCISVMGWEEGGFAIIARDDRFDELQGYSDSPFCIEEMPPVFMQLLEGMNDKMAQLIASDAAPSTSDDPHDIIVPPLIKTKWYQLKPFNQMCPIPNMEDVEKYNYPTGCTATACAQLAYYYKTPNAGMGIGGYVNNLTRGEKEFLVDLRELRWNFDDMLLDYNGEYTDKQAAAVASLMFACGAANRAYYCNESLTSAILVYDDDFALHFGYEMKEIEASFDSISHYLDNATPVYAQIANPSHSVIIDGYDNGQFIHVNFGWGGYADGFYPLNEMQGFTWIYLCKVITSTDNPLEEIDKLWYKLKADTHKASLTYNNAFYCWQKPLGIEGDITVPANVVFNGETYDVVDIDGRAFGGSEVTSITIPESVTYVCNLVTNGKHHICCLCTTPPVLENIWPFLSIKEFKCPLYVPDDAVETYRNTFPWSLFPSILPLSELEGISNTMVDEQVSKVYDIAGRSVKNAVRAHGVYIENGRRSAFRQGDACFSKKVFR